MLFVVSGPWGVGKSEIIKYLCDNYGCETSIPWTTKEVSGNEHGTKYNVLYKHDAGKPVLYTEKDLKDFENFFDTPYDAQYIEQTQVANIKEKGFWSQPFALCEEYQVNGYKIDEIINLSSRNASVIEADTSVVGQLVNAANMGAIGRVIAIFLDYEHEEVFHQKLIHDIKINKIQHQKESHAKKEKEYYNAHKEIFGYYIQSDEIEEICYEISRIIRELVKPTPSMLHKRAGALGSQDIKLAIEVKDVIISIDDTYSKEVENCLGQELYLNGKLNDKTIQNVAVDLHLAPKCKILSENHECESFDFILGMNKTLKELLKHKNISSIEHMDGIAKNQISKYVCEARETTLKQMYEDKTMSLQDGLKLQAGQIALCTTLEKIELRDNIIGFITSKCSLSQMGVSISLSQNIIQSNSADVVSLQIKNNLPYPIVIYPYMKMAQIIFMRTISSTNKLDNNKTEFVIQKFVHDPEFNKLSEAIIEIKNWKEYQQTYDEEKREEKKNKRENQNIQRAIALGTMGSFIMALLAVIISIVN
ncbi:MAG: hypothetical protein HFI74_12445 [Lachnospiraceae bacterium]|jgi:deoxycytidine triphosphate deaminase/guanylate kinase|nr:hypothetical protein [Lachnospiraceae bacterium]